MRKAGIGLLALLLVMGGCDGCQRESAPPTSAPQPQIGAPGAPAAPQAPAAEAPAAQAPAAEAPGAMADEDDCIVIADANPDYGPPPLAVEFSAEAECTSGEPTYKWEFGDGSTAAEANPKHSYAKAGDFTAIVTVTAGGATATDEIDITVEEDAELEETD